MVEAKFSVIVLVEKWNILLQNLSNNTSNFCIFIMMLTVSLLYLCFALLMNVLSAHIYFLIGKDHVFYQPFYYT